MFKAPGYQRENLLCEYSITDPPLNINGILNRTKHFIIHKSFEITDVTWGIKSTCTFAPKEFKTVGGLSKFF
jgi:hypothetical protein